MDQINIWQNLWVVNEDGMFIVGEKVDGLEKLCDLIDFGAMEWGLELVLYSYEKVMLRQFLRCH